MSERKRSFPPVVDSQTRLLILGSLPGDASLAKAQYYGHPQNKFWELVGSVIGLDLRALPYELRLARLLEHGVGLWDVIAEAERPGSLDAAIRNEVHNTLAELITSQPHLRAVAFNGGTAARHGRRQLKPLMNQALTDQAHEDQLALIDLPSSSPAYTLRLAEKQALWAPLRQYL